MASSGIVNTAVSLMLLVETVAFPVKAGAADVNTCDSLFAQGKALVERYEYEAAIGKFSQMLEIAGEWDGAADSARALNSIGEVHYQLYSYDTAMFYFESALVQAKCASDTRLEGMILNSIGRCHYAKGEFGQAVAQCDSALIIASRLQDDRLVGRALHTLAMTFVYSGKIDEAASLIDSVLRIVRAAGDRKEEARVLRSVGELYNIESDFEMALAYCDSALHLARETGDMRIESGVLDLLGLIYCQLSQYDKAVVCLESCMAIDRTTVGRVHPSMCMSLQWAYRALGDCPKALAYCDSAIAIARAMKNSREIAKCLLYRSATLVDFSQFDAAISCLDSARAIASEIDDTLTMTYILGSLGETYLHLKQYDRALERLVEGQNKAHELNDVFLETGMKICIGLSHGGLNDFEAALAYFDSALTCAREINVVHYIGWCYDGIGSVHFERGQYDKALAYYDSAFVIFRRFKYKNHQAMMLDHLGQVYEKLGDPEKAVDHYKRSIEIRESIRITIRQAEFLSAYIKAERDVYERLVILLIMLERYEEAFDYLERSHSMKLRKAFEAGDIAVYDPSLRRILERINLLEVEMEGVKNRFRSGEIDEIVCENMLGELEGKLNQRIVDLRIHHPRLYDVIVPQRKTLKFIQGLMPDSTIFVEYVSINETYVALLFSKNIFLVVSLEESRHSVDSLVLNFLSTLQPRVEKDVVDRECARLYEVLMKPLAATIDEFPDIVVIPYGVLHYLPFHILRCENQDGKFEYLLERRRVSYLPSASFLTDLLEEKELAEKALLAFGNADGTLPSAEIEVDFIAEIFPDACIYKADRARKDMFIDLCGDYRLIHLATHGILNPDPRFSYIVLAPPHEGDLTIREILGLSGHFKRSSLVTLSACETAIEADPETAGAELVTLANAFKVAGVPTTVASLWEIADRSTAILMRNFYENLKGRKMDKLEALRQAQIEVIRHGQYSHPYYWAAFILIGSWR